VNECKPLGSGSYGMRRRGSRLNFADDDVQANAAPGRGVLDNVDNTRWEHDLSSRECSCCQLRFVVARPSYGHFPTARLWVSRQVNLTSLECLF